MGYTAFRDHCPFCKRPARRIVRGAAEAVWLHESGRFDCDPLSCPACCGKDVIYARPLDRYVHTDGSDNETCWSDFEHTSGRACAVCGRPESGSLRLSGSEESPNVCRPCEVLEEAIGGDLAQARAIYMRSGPALLTALEVVEAAINAASA